MSVTTETLRIINEIIYRGKGENRQLNTDLKTTSTNAKKLNVDWSQMAQGIGAVTGAAGALGAAYVQLYQIMGQGAQVQATQLTFDNLAMSIGETSDIMLGDLRRATGGMIADMELMQAANQFTAMGLATTSDEAAKLAQIGSTLGAAFRGDANAGMEEFALLLANQSIPRLDSFGISAGAVRTRIAELQAEFPDMNRETAFMQAVMEQAEITMGKLGDNSASAAAQMSIFESNIKNVKDEGTLMVTEALLPTLTAFNNLVTASNEATTNLEAFQTSIGIGMQQALSGGARTLDFMNVSLQAIANLDYSNPIDFLESINGAMARIEGAGGGSSVGRLKDDLEEVNDAVADGVPLWHGYRQVMITLGDAIEEDVITVIQNSTNVLKDQQSAFLEFDTSTFIETLNATEIATLDVEQALLKQAAAAGADQTSLVLLAAATGDYTDEQINAALEMAAMTAFIDEQAAALAAGNITWQEALNNVQAFRAELAAIPDTITVDILIQQSGQFTPPELPGGPSGGTVSAAGNVFPHGGYSMVGEFGPEFVRLPAGAQVVSTNRTANTVNNTTFNGTTRRGERVLLDYLRRSSRPATITG